MATVISKERIFEAYERVKAGELIYKVAADYGVSETYFYRAFVQMGLNLPTRKRGPSRRRANQDLTEQQVRDAHASYCAGGVFSVIAHELNVTATILRHQFNKFGLSRKLREYPQEKKDAVIADYMAGVSLDDLVEKYHMSFYNIKNICDDLPYFNDQVISPELAKQIYEELQTNSTWKMISEKYRIRPAKIKARFKELGWKAVRLLPFDEVTTEQIVADYDSGMSWVEMGHKYGVSRRAVQALFKRRNINRPIRKAVITDEILSEAEQLLGKGLSLRHIADALKVNHFTLKKAYATRKGPVKKGRPGAKTLLSDHKIITAHHQLVRGDDRKKICDDLRVSWETLKNNFARLGLPPVKKSSQKPFQRQEFGEVEILEAYEKHKAGAGRKEVCSLLKISWSEVVKQFTKLNLPPVNELPTDAQLKKRKNQQRTERPAQSNLQATPYVLAQERQAGASVEALAKKYKLPPSQVRQMLIAGFLTVQK